MVCKELELLPYSKSVEINRSIITPQGAGLCATFLRFWNDYQKCLACVINFRISAYASDTLIQEVISEWDNLIEDIDYLLWLVEV